MKVMLFDASQCWLVCSSLLFVLPYDTGNDIMRTVIQYKWNSYARWMFLKRFFFFILFLIAFVWTTWVSRPTAIFGETSKTSGESRS